MIWDTVIKAIDHQMDRNAKGLRSGIDTAKAQSGHGASITPSTSVGSEISSGSNEGNGDQAVEQAVAENQPAATEGGLPNTTDTSGQQGDDSDSGVAIKSAEADDGDTGSADSSAGSVGGEDTAGSADSVADIAGDVMSDERLKAKECASSVIGKWHSKGKILSDASAKASKNVSTETSDNDSKAASTWEKISNKISGVSQAMGQGGRDIAAMVSGNKASANVNTQETAKAPVTTDTETSKKATDAIEGKTWKDKFKEKATAVSKALAQ